MSEQLLFGLPPFYLGIIVTVAAIGFRFGLGVMDKPKGEIKIKPLIQTAIVAFTTSIVLVVDVFEILPAGLSDSALMTVVITQFMAIYAGDNITRTLGKKIGIKKDGVVAPKTPPATSGVTTNTATPNKTVVSRRLQGDSVALTYSDGSTQTIQIP